MSLPLSQELVAVLEQAQVIAARQGQASTSVHLLLALVGVPNGAGFFLGDRDVSADMLHAAEQRLGSELVESPVVLERIQERGERIATAAGAEVVGALHVLAALVRESSSAAVGLLKGAGVNVSAIRASVMSYASGSATLPRRVRSGAAHTVPGGVQGATRAREDAPSSIGFHPSLGVQPRAPRASVDQEVDALGRSDVSAATQPMSEDGLGARGVPTMHTPGGPDVQPVAPIPASRSWQSPAPRRRASTSSASTRPVQRDARITPRRGRPPAPDPANTTPGTVQTAPQPRAPLASPEQAAMEDARKATRNLADRLFNKLDPRLLHADAPDAPDAPDAADDAPPATSPGDIQSPEVARDDQKGVRASISEIRPSIDEIRPSIDEIRPSINETVAPQGFVQAPNSLRGADDLDADDLDAPELDASDDATMDALADARGGAGRATHLSEEISVVETIRLEDPLEPDAELARAYLLNKDEYPNLVKYGRNITAQAARGEVDRVVGRDAEILQLIDVLGKRRANNPVLVGEAGVGKTAIVEGLSREFVKLAQAGNRLGKRAIIELELGRILSGTHLRGSFSERLIGIKDEVEAAGGDVIVFLDELHAWMSAGGGGDGTDAASELKTALARGRFPCIGATTHDEFRRFVESDPAFERRLQVVLVEEPDLDTARHIADGIRGHYEKHHGVRYDDEALDAAVRLSHRYIYQRRLPDKAIGVLDLAGSRAARTGQALVGRELVAEIVAEMAGIPPGRLNQTDRQRFLEMESHLEARVVGHRGVIQTVSELIRRNYAGFRGRRPIGSLLFLGPTGVGKTELVKALADFLFHDADAMVRLDMSEFMEAHSVSRMLGAPPGYVGHEQGGQLTEAVRRRPYQIVLLDEVEKAHPDVLNILLQLFDEGRVTDGRGRTVDFSNTVIVMTSNLGAEVFAAHYARAGRGRIGFGGDAGGAGIRDADKLTDGVLDAARGHFRPELWNRIDEKLVFMPLEREEVAEIARLQLADSSRRLHTESGMTLAFDEEVIEHLIDHGGFDPQFGARPMRQTIQRLIESAVARLILSGGTAPGAQLRVTVQAGEVVCVGDLQVEHPLVK